MMRSRSAQLVCALAIVALTSSTGWATIGAGVLDVAGANSTPTHFDIPTGAVTTATICGVATGEVGDPLPATITVWVKSSNLGNTELTANLIADTDCYEFSYTPPTGACNTTIVAYQDLGLEANNDMADDGVVNGSGTAASGLRFVDEFGNPIECTVPIDDVSWGMIKSLYR